MCRLLPHWWLTGLRNCVNLVNTWHIPHLSGYICIKNLECLLNLPKTSMETVKRKRKENSGSWFWFPVRAKSKPKMFYIQRSVPVTACIAVRTSETDYRHAARPEDAHHLSVFHNSRWPKVEQRVSGFLRLISGTVAAFKDYGVANHQDMAYLVQSVPQDCAFSLLESFDVKSFH